MRKLKLAESDEEEEALIIRPLPRKKVRLAAKPKLHKITQVEAVKAVKDEEVMAKEQEIIFAPVLSFHYDFKIQPLDKTMDYTRFKKRKRRF